MPRQNTFNILTAAMCARCSGAAVVHFVDVHFEEYMVSIAWSIRNQKLGGSELY